MNISTTTAPAVQPHRDYSSILSQVQGQMLNTQSVLGENAGSTSYAYEHLLNRIPAVPETSFDSSQDEASQLTYERVIDFLLHQPPEIRTIILTHLEGRDLLSLRATSHALHNLVHDSAKAISLSLADRITKTHDLTQIPIIISDLPAFLQVSKQYTSLCTVAETVAERISWHLRLIHGRLDKEAHEAWRQKKLRRLQIRLTRAMIVLQQYLNFLSDTLNQNERHLQPLDDDEFTTLHNVFDLDQQAYLANHMNALTEKEFIDITATLNIFKSTCKARCVPFMLKANAFPFVSVRQILIYKGLAPFAELLAKDVGPAQQQAILKRLSGEIGSSRRPDIEARYRPPCFSIRTLEGYHRVGERPFDHKRGYKERDIFIAHQDIWDRAARALMMPKLGRFPNIQSATTWIQKVCAVPGEERESDIVVGAWDHQDGR